MVIGLARWLRAAGYKAETPTQGLSDNNVLHAVVENKLFLITRDRALSERRELRNKCLLLTTNDLPSWVLELNQIGLVDWRLAPFSRCFECNGEIKPLKAHEFGRLGQVPPWTVAKYEDIYLCDSCGKAYWKGSHYWKIDQQLTRWNQMRLAIHGNAIGL